MGCDIHTLIEVKVDGKWTPFKEQIFVDQFEKPSMEPFDWRSYRMFGVLAGVRNYSAIPPIKVPIGLPKDFNNDDPELWIGDHSFTWYYLKELLEFDWDKECEDRRVSMEIAPGETCELGQGVKTTYREMVGERFFRDLRIMKERFDPENTRIIIGFDS